MDDKPPHPFSLDFVPTGDDYVEQPRGDLPEFWINWPKCRLIDPDKPEETREGYLWAKSRTRVVLILNPQVHQTAYETVIAPIENCHSV